MEVIVRVESGTETESNAGNCRGAKNRLVVALSSRVKRKNYFLLFDIILLNSVPTCRDW